MCWSPERADGGVRAGGAEQNPFLRYRTLLSPYRLARSAGLSDDAWGEIVGQLDEALIAVDGARFPRHADGRADELGRGAGLPHALWVKDETGNVSGSHKARHLMGVMLYLRVLETRQAARRRRPARAPAGHRLLRQCGAGGGGHRARRRLAARRVHSARCRSRR